MGILVTGGAGYIGSVVAADLLSKGEEVVVLDNLYRGHKAAVRPGIHFYNGDMSDRELLSRIFKSHSIEACFHFSAYSEVGESVQKPLMYYTNNFSQTLVLLEALIQANVKRFIFSSTCAVYGEPQYIPLDEKHAQKPESPYGWSKLMVERSLQDLAHSNDFQFVVFRYFNACGATEDLGEHHTPESHLIPLVLAAAQKKLPHIKIFGRDYPTNDGTAIRDYIHVSDLSQAHILGLEYLRKGGASSSFNLGSGVGFSVLQIIEAARRITGKEIVSIDHPRRAGDPSRLIADSTRAKEVLGWNPSASNLDHIIESAWKWILAHPNGYLE